VPFTKEIETFDGKEVSLWLMITGGFVELLLFMFWTITMIYLFVKFHKIDESSKIYTLKAGLHQKNWFSMIYYF